MKREFITGLLPEIDKTILDQIMAEQGKDIENAKLTSRYGVLTINVNFFRI